MSVLNDRAEREVLMLLSTTDSVVRPAVALGGRMDVEEMEHKGDGIGWRSPTMLRTRICTTPKGEHDLASARSVTGHYVTRGRAHMGGPEETLAVPCNDPGRVSIRHVLHGRLTAIPGRRIGRGEKEGGIRHLLWAEGTVKQHA